MRSFMRFPWHWSWCIALSVTVGCAYPTYRYVEDDAAVALDTGGDMGSDDAAVEAAPNLDVCAPNGCGGCNDVGFLGGRCEPCGQWICDGTRVSCKPTTPTPGTACGTCMTSTYTCNANGLSVCAAADDRTVFQDLAFETRDDALFVVDRSTEVVVSYDVARNLALTDASFSLRKLPYLCAKTAALPHPDPACSTCAAAAGGGFDCTVPTKTNGTLKLTVYSGTPATGLVQLASGTVDAAAPATALAWQSIALTAELANRTVGSKLSVGLSTESSAFAFEIHGGGASSFPKAPMSMSWWHRTLKPSGAWIEEPATDVALVVRGKACAP